MITSAMGVQSFRWPAGVYLATNDYNHIVMAMETSITKEGVSYLEVTGTPTENEELKQNYVHLCKLRDEVIAMGILPEIKDWHLLNSNIQ